MKRLALGDTQALATCLTLEPTALGELLISCLPQPEPLLLLAEALLDQMELQSAWDLLAQVTTALPHLKADPAVADLLASLAAL
jgi:hypothetical protein